MSDEQCGADPFENGYDQKLSEKEYRERIKYLMRCHDDSTDEIERLRTENERLREALERLIAACDQGRVVPKPGCSTGGMTLEANLRASNINGVSASAVEDARAALGEEKK